MALEVETTLLPPPTLKVRFAGVAPVICCAEAAPAPRIRARAAKWRVEYRVSDMTYSLIQIRSVYAEAYALFSSDRITCGAELACAIAATDACSNTCALVRLAASVATSASRMLDSVAEKFVIWE